MVDKVVVKPHDKHRFEVVEKYEYKGVVVPAGFLTNGANIPRVFWSIYPPNNPKYLSAIVVHDFLCETKEFKKADTYLKDMMSELECSKFDVVLFYFVVRLYHLIRYKV